MIPKEEWKTGWVDGIPRRQYCYITWDQVSKYHDREKTKELAAYLFGCDGVAIVGEQTACFLAFDYLIWLKSKEKDNASTCFESEHCDVGYSGSDRPNSCMDGDGHSAHAAQEDRYGAGDNESHRI